MADAQAGRAILELGTRENRSTSQARLSWMIPACHHSKISHPINLDEGTEKRREKEKGKEKKGAPPAGTPGESWALGRPGWLVGWLVFSVAWAEQSSKLQVEKDASCCNWALAMRPWPIHHST